MSAGVVLSGGLVPSQACGVSGLGERYCALGCAERFEEELNRTRARGERRFSPPAFESPFLTFCPACT